jgi:hypothetical protein
MTIPRDLRLRPSALALALFLFLMNRHTLAAQLWDIPPLPSVEVAPAADGLTPNIGNEHLIYQFIFSQHRSNEGAFVLNA